LQQGANPHIEDLTGQDSCDYAKFYKIYSLASQLSCKTELRRPATIERQTHFKRKVLDKQVVNQVKEKTDEVAKRDRSGNGYTIHDDITKQEVAKSL